jgi:hypothetical protein
MYSNFTSCLSLQLACCAQPSQAPYTLLCLQIAERGLDLEEEAQRVGDLARPEFFLNAIKTLLAGELMAEPCLRQIVRSELYQ